jgi:hypothetical protein
MSERRTNKKVPRWNAARSGRLMMRMNAPAGSHVTHIIDQVKQRMLTPS